MSEKGSDPVEVTEYPTPWVFVDRKPTIEEMRELLAQVPAVHGISVKDYEDFVLPLTQNQTFRREGSDVKLPTTRLYMTVGGRVRMLADAAESNGWTVSEEWDWVNDDPKVLRIGVRIEELGIRYGTSKAKGGDTWMEKMETAARGRAIAAWGFGVLPGSGIASLEEMEDALYGEPERRQKPTEKRPKDDVLDDVRSAMEELRLLRGQEPEELDEKLQTYIKQRLGQTIQVGDTGLDLEKLKPGNLLLLERQLRMQIAKEQRDQAEV